MEATSIAVIPGEGATGVLLAGVEGAPGGGGGGMGVLRGVLWERGGGPLGGAGVLGGGLAADVGVVIVIDCWRNFAMESPYLVMGAASRRDLNTQMAQRDFPN